MTNGIKVDENTFATLDHNEQIKAIFHAIVATNANFCKQIPMCEANMDNKIKINNKLHRKINLGIGGGTGAFIIGAFETIKALWK